MTLPSAGDMFTEQLASLGGLFVVDLPKFLNLPINPPADRGFCDSGFGVIVALPTTVAVGKLLFILPILAAAIASLTPICPCRDVCRILGPK